MTLVLIIVLHWIAIYMYKKIYFSCMNNSVISFVYMCTTLSENSYTNNGSLLQCVHFISIFIFENYVQKIFNMQANLVLFKKSF